METPLFPLGQTVITRRALDVLHPGDVKLCIDRHARGDWGDLCEHDRNENRIALDQGLRLFSVYKDRCGIKMYIITEHDRSITTVLLPEDY